MPSFFVVLEDLRVAERGDVGSTPRTYFPVHLTRKSLQVMDDGRYRTGRTAYQAEPTSLTMQSTRVYTELFYR